MSLQKLLGEVSKQQFAADYLHRLPFSLPGAASEFRPLGTWDVLGEILEQQAADVMVVRGGAQLAGAEPKNVQEAKALCGEGHTILVRHAERHHPELKRLAKSFEEDLGAPANIHVYVTPPGSHGFSWHYDAEDVFIIQTAGAKRYSLRRNTVNPWPLVETIPHDMRFERETMPLLRVELWAGDWLYIPCGYWHKAEAKEGDEAAISLALGVMSPSAIDMFDFLRTRLLDSMLWRQRLPIAGTASPLRSEELDARYREILRQLADDIGAQLGSESFASLYREWADRTGE